MLRLAKPQARFFSNFKWGDSVLVRQLYRNDVYWLIESLTEGKSLSFQKGTVGHDQIVGKGPRSIIQSHSTKKSRPFMVTFPTFQEYILLIPRAVRPIYAIEAGIMGQLADIHLDYLTEDDLPLQFLEAGTGQGCLSLVISKLLHPANALAKLKDDSSLRRAILHTVDCNESNIARAKKIVKGFRRGIYYDNIEFHLAEGPSQWIQSTSFTDAFLDGCFLDMPEPELHLQTISKYLKPGAPILIFQPSVTQFFPILEVTKKVGFSCVSISEMAGNGGLREWDLRKVHVEEQEKLVCRPKSSPKLLAGGFLGIWRKGNHGQEIAEDSAGELHNILQ